MIQPFPLAEKHISKDRLASNQIESSTSSSAKNNTVPQVYERHRLDNPNKTSKYVTDSFVQSCSSHACNDGTGAASSACSLDLFLPGFTEEKRLNSPFLQERGKCKLSQEKWVRLGAPQAGSGSAGSLWSSNWAEVRCEWAPPPPSSLSSPWGEARPTLNSADVTGADACSPSHPSAPNPH